MEPLLKRLEQWLTHQRPRFLTGLNPGASAQLLAQFQTAIRVPVPDDLKSLLAWRDGQGDDFIGYFEENWRLMRAEQIAAAKRDLDQDAADFGWNPRWIPFLDDDSGGYLCLDPSTPGCPVRAFWPGNADHPVVADSLRSWLARFVDDLEKGNYQEDPERGRMQRRSEQ